MHKLVAAMFCEKAIVDSRTNQVSAIGLIETMTTPGLPMVVAGPFSLVSIWYLDQDLPDGPEIIARNDLCLPSGTVKIARGHASLPRQAGFHRIFMDMLTLPLDESGLYEVQIKVGPLGALEHVGSLRFKAESDPERYEAVQKQIAELQ